MDENTVFVGRKPMMSYVLAAVTQFTEGAREVTIKARGRAIATAVDVAEVVRNRFVQDASVKDVRIGTEQVENDRGEKLNVSSIEITLSKPAPA